MTALTDHFAVTHTREDKFTYVTWSQVADRLDEAGEPWSFSIMAVGADWAHGRLTIGDRHYENVGYGENAAADWKKEVLKDAVSDAFKRCAALAGVARYLYDKDAGPQRQAQQRPGAPVTRQPAAVSVPPRPHVVNTNVPDPDEDWLPPADAAGVQHPATVDDSVDCPIHGVPWAGGPGDLWHKDPDGRYCRHPDNVKRARAR